MTTPPVWRPRACVIGAGVMGLSVAWQLALRSVDVLVVDRREPGAEASAANAGTVAVQNKKPAAIPLVMHALAMWDRMNDALGIDVEYERRGGLRVAESDDEVSRLEQAAAEQRKAGAHVEIVAHTQLKRLAPYLAPSIRAAAWCPDDGMANPLAYMRGLLRTCRRLGVVIWSNAEVTSILSRGPGEFDVETGRGTVRCAEVLVAGGAWNADLGRLAGLELPVTTQIQQAMVTDDAPFFLPHVITHVRGNLTVKQQRAGRLLVGGAWAGDGDRSTGTKQLRRDSLVGNLQLACRVVPDVRWVNLLRGWVGFEGRTPDKLLVAGPVPATDGLFLLGCASGGFTVSPAAGVLVADLMTTGRSELPWKPFTVDRLLDPARVGTSGPSPKEA